MKTGTPLGIDRVHVPKDPWDPRRLRRLRRGDRVRVVSPASTPDRDRVRCSIELLESWGLVVEVANHVYARHGHYLAGRDDDRAGDLNEALRDPDVRAIFVARGGKVAYRIADAIDFDAARADPKPLIGYSETTILHLALWKNCRVGGFHGPHVDWLYEDGHAADSLRRAVMDPEPLVIGQEPDAFTAGVIVRGAASGFLMGGNLDMLRTSVGWQCPSFAGAFLLIEAVDMQITVFEALVKKAERGGSFPQAADRRMVWKD